MLYDSPMESEKLIAIIKERAPSINQVILELINEHDTRQMEDGVKYYFNKNDIRKHQQYYYDSNGNKVIDKDKVNNKIPHGWHKLLVDQKVSYLVGKPITFNTEDKVFEEKINLYLGEDWDDTASELVKNASNKGKEYLHPYIDEEGNFNYVIIPAEQIIPIYKNSLKKEIVSVIRYYMIGDVMKVELWDETTVTYYEKVGGELVVDINYENNPESHFRYGIEGQEGNYGWGKVPFIEFRNNEEAISDLSFYKDLIDEYDKTVSGMANNLEEIQSLIYVLKGYDGANLAEFMENLRHFKAIKVSEDGGIDTLETNVPVASVDSHLDRTEDSLFTFGMGVNTNTDKMGNAPSGVSLRFLYSSLDMKANMQERKFKKALELFMWFLAEYLRIKEKENHDYKSVSFVFNKTMIMNESEQVDIAQKSSGIIPQEIILANHPWVHDVEAAKKMLEEEKSAYQIDLDEVDVDEQSGQVE